MKPEVKQSLAYFIAMSIVVTTVLFLIPIELFNGEITYLVGATEHTESVSLSLSYLIGIGYSPSDMDTIVDFHLTSSGIVTAFIFTLGIPGLIAYRIYLHKTKE